MVTKLEHHYNGAMFEFGNTLAAVNLSKLLPHNCSDRSKIAKLLTNFNFKLRSVANSNMSSTVKMDIIQILRHDTLERVSLLNLEDVYAESLTRTCVCTRYKHALMHVQSNKFYPSANQIRSKKRENNGC